MIDVPETPPQQRERIRLTVLGRRSDGGGRSQPDIRTFVPDAPHGTSAGYLTWNCGCMWCRAAQEVKSRSFIMR